MTGLQSPLVVGLLTALSLPSFAAAGNGTRCFECTDAPHPADCTRVSECAPGQICFVNQFITTGGLILYNSGCMSTQRCAPMFRRKRETYKSLSRREDISICLQCCHGDFCNNEGCDSASLKQPQRGPLCFACDYASTPKKCRTVTRCAIGQVCMLTEIPPNVPEGYTLYNSKCQRPKDCEQFSVGRKRNNYCHVCCKDDFCNDDCTNSITTVAIKTTTTPTVTTTTPSATTPSTITTTHSAKEQCLSHHDYRYDSHSHLCYKIHHSEETWTNANKVCEHEGGTLAIVDTTDKWGYLKSKLEADHHLHRDVYIGAKKSDHDFVWPNGHKLTFKKWANHQPDDHGTVCIYLRHHDHYAWHDNPCSHKYAYVCTISV